MRKSRGEEARLAFLDHALMENRNRLLMDCTVSPATGTAERDAVSALPDGCGHGAPRWRPRPCHPDDSPGALRTQGVPPGLRGPRSPRVGGRAGDSRAHQTN